MAITNFQVGTSVTAAYTASAETAITVIYITNKTDGDGTVDVYVTPTVVSATANHLVYSQLTMKSRDTYILDTEKMMLESGAKICIAAPYSAAQFNATISTIGL